MPRKLVFAVAYKIVFAASSVGVVNALNRGNLLLNCEHKTLCGDNKCISRSGSEYRRDDGKENYQPKNPEHHPRFTTTGGAPSIKSSRASARLRRADESAAGHFDACRRLALRYQVDGYRALALGGGREPRIVSRNRKDLGKKFPEIASSIGELDIRDAIIDGEIVALDDKGRSSFQLLQGYDMGLVRPPIVFLCVRFAAAKSLVLQSVGQSPYPANEGCKSKSVPTRFQRF